MSDVRKLIEEAEALCEKATAAPWRDDNGEILSGPYRIAALPGVQYSVADAALIARARTLVPELVAVVEAWRPIVEAAVDFDASVDTLDATLNAERLWRACEALRAKGGPLP